MTSEYPFMNNDLNIEKRLDDLMGRLTLNEKIRLCHGKRIYWSRPIKRLGIPSMKMTDGPHGIGTGVYVLKKMTYFPVAICRAATWNQELSYKFGEALAEETRAVGRHMILAPGINIIRTPLCGRNFEYQTEDPFLNSRIVVELTKGVQSKRISTCIKHFAANNQE
ncbi:MAG: glycoside hydrolase family 3 N-terminal domain-containing protein, partial [Promethearchaeota archaeon]